MVSDHWQAGRVRVVVVLVAAIAITALAGWKFAVSRAGGGLASPALASTAAAPRATQPSQAATASRGFAASLDDLQRAAAKLPSTSSDPAAKAAALGGDVASAFAFVRDQVNDEVYAGILRGARGTLLDGSGNAADKSLLLAALLRARGLTVRFVRGRLAPDTAAALVDQMFAAVPKRGRLALPPAQSGEPAAMTRLRTLLGEWNVNAEEVQGMLRQSGVALGQNGATPRSALVAEAADHTWIEVEQDGNWTALDPSFRDAKPGQTFAAADSKVNELSLALAHTITIRVVAEERTGSAIASHDVLRYQDSAAALNGALVVLYTQLAVTSSGWTASPFIQVGDRLFTGRPFTANGIANTSIGRGMSGGLSAVTQAFGGEAPPAAAPQRDLAGVWIVVDFHSPDGHTETVRRAMLDRIGPAARVAHDEGVAALLPIALVSGRPAALSGLYACAFSAGRFPAGFAAAQLSARMPQLRAAAPLAAAVASGRDLSDDERTRGADGLAPALPALLHASALAFYRVSQASLDLVRSASDANVWFYEAAPRLVITSLELVPAPDGTAIRLQTSVDLRRNAMRAVSENADGPQAAWANVLRGVLDGALEQTLFGDAPPPHSQLVRSGSTVSVFEASRAADAPRVLVRTPDALAHLNLPDIARARMRAALDAGRTALVVPQRPLTIGSQSLVGWWQVDVDTGETLGVLDSGLHQEFEEYEETTMVSRAWTGPAPTPSVWSIETSRGAIVATSEEAGLAAFGEELAQSVANVTRFLR